MSENIAPNSELDLDEWLAMGERTVHNVNLYARFDLIAEIDALEAKKVPVEDVPEGDEALGGSSNPNAGIEAEIDEIKMRIHASKKVFRVTSLTDAEIAGIRETVLTDCSKDIDKQAELGKKEARKTAARMEVKTPADVNALVRLNVNEFTRKFIEGEIRLRMIAASTTLMSKGQLVQITLEQTRTLYEKLGEAQMRLLADASARATQDIPVVNVPKS
ncbi:putative tail assembly chaperone [Glutamicibacter phage BIM BV-113]|nr:putative tail assembly chaperone [Glutamicibacter phage BIM BV-113]